MKDPWKSSKVMGGGIIVALDAVPSIGEHASDGDLTVRDWFEVTGTVAVGAAVVAASVAAGAPLTVGSLVIGAFAGFVLGEAGEWAGGLIYDLISPDPPEVKADDTTISSGETRVVDTPAGPQMVRVMEIIDTPSGPQTVWTGSHYDYSGTESAWRDSTVNTVTTTTSTMDTTTTTVVHGEEFAGPKPILLDLDGDGIEVSEVSQSTMFLDADGSGKAHRTAWAGKGDGVLFWDAEDDGRITQKREYVFTEWDPSADSDFEALRARFDSNDDGKLTAADARFSQFKVMVTQADGTRVAMTLAQLDNNEGDIEPNNEQACLKATLVASKYTTEPNRLNPFLLHTCRAYSSQSTLRMSKPNSAFCL